MEADRYGSISLMPFCIPNSQFKLKRMLRHKTQKHTLTWQADGETDRRSWPGRCKMAIVKWLQRGTMTSTKSERRGQTDGEGGGWEDVSWQIIQTVLESFKI